MTYKMRIKFDNREWLVIDNIEYEGIKYYYIIEDISEETISNSLYTVHMPDPDLLIRTGGEKRISNYLLWQIAYAEILVTKEFWPEFNKDSLANAVIDFHNRQRRWGK